MKKHANTLLSFCLLLFLSLGLLPVQAGAYDSFGDAQAAAAILIDVTYDTILYEKNAHERREPASVTKAMTALLVMEAIDRGELQLDQLITATGSALYDITADSSTQNIQAGEQLTVEQLLYCLMLPSANEAGNILAEAVSGKVPAFVEQMNLRAGELGMTNTHFNNPHGLNTADHYTTAYDLSLMVRAAMKFPVFQRIVSTEEYTVPATNLSKERTFFNTNALLSDKKVQGYIYKYVTGVKTGYTPNAGYCLASSAQKGDRTLVAIVLGTERIQAPDGKTIHYQFGESRRLLEWGFENFSMTTMVNPDMLLKEIPVSNGKDVSHVVGIPAETISRLLPQSYNEENLEMNISLRSDTLLAPVNKGQVLGEITLSYEGTDYGKCDLVAAIAVELSLLGSIYNVLQHLFEKGFIWIFLALIFVVVLVRYLRALRRVPRKKRAPARPQPPQNKKPSPKGKPAPNKPTAPRPSGSKRSSAPPKSQTQPPRRDKQHPRMRR